MSAWSGVLLLLAIWIGLNVWDVILTSRILARGGRELNPLIRRFGLVPVKTVGVIVGVAVAVTPWWKLLVGMDVMMLGICLWNAWVLRRLRSRLPG